MEEKSKSRIHVKDHNMIYHLTSLENLDSILENGLLCRKNIEGEFDDVANPDMITSREREELEKYVPFHFFPRNPFDGEVFSNHPEKEFIYICVTKQKARDKGFKVIPTHPMSMSEFKIYDFDKGIEAIDWEFMNERDYKNNDCKHVCMAECICKGKVEPYNFTSIYVRDENTRKIVQPKIQKYLKDNNLRKNIFVNIMEGCFPKKNKEVI